MIRDNFYVAGGDVWAVSISGIENGAYIVYAYAPTNSSVSSGDFFIYGEAFASIPGDGSGALVEGVSYVKSFAQVTTGSISLLGTGPGVTGLAGVQIVRLPPQGLNIDFGVSYGVPSPTASGGVPQAGIWNEAGLGTNALVDRVGNETGVSVVVAADATGSSSGGDEMIRDNFYSNGGNAWSVDLDGIPNGGYVAYVYAPIHSSVSSGDFQLNLTPFASIPGDPSGDFVEGVSYVKTYVEVTSGTVSLSGDDPSFSGLAGLQMVPIPEPGFLSTIAAGGACLSMLSRRRRSS